MTTDARDEITHDGCWFRSRVDAFELDVRALSVRVGPLLNPDMPIVTLFEYGKSIHEQNGDGIPILGPKILGDITQANCFWSIAQIDKTTNSGTFCSGILGSNTTNKVLFVIFSFFFPPTRPRGTVFWSFFTKHKILDDLGVVTLYNGCTGLLVSE